MGCLFKQKMLVTVEALKLMGLRVKSGAVYVLRTVSLSIPAVLSRKWSRLLTRHLKIREAVDYSAGWPRSNYRNWSGGKLRISN